MITSTIYTLQGDIDDAATRAIKAEVYLVPRVGGVAFEIEDGKESRMILKHKEEDLIDRATIDAAVRKAGDYSLA